MSDIPRLTNRPGQPRLRYRSGHQADILTRMVEALPHARIPSGQGAGQRPLEHLSPSGTPDAIPALLDAFACAADVVTFYQEQLVQELYLRTGTELRSLLELSGAIGYSPRPGVAAEVGLALTVDDGFPEGVEVPAGLRLQHIPTQGERPQTFETTAPLTVRKEWNRLVPVKTTPQTLASGSSSLYLSGLQVSLQVGDPLLLVGDERLADPDAYEWEFCRVLGVSPLPALGITRVDLDRPLGSSLWGNTPPLVNARLYVLRQRTQLFGYNAPDWLVMPENVQQAYWSEVMGTPPSPQNGYPGKEWPGLTAYDPLSAAPLLELDGHWPGMLTPGWMVMEAEGVVRLFRTQSGGLSTRSRFAVTSRTTVLSVDNVTGLGPFCQKVRTTVCYLGAELLPLADAPRWDEFQPSVLAPIGQSTGNSTFVVSGSVPVLEVGRAVMVSGRRLRARVVLPGFFLKVAGVSRSLEAGESLPLAKWPSPWAGPTSWWLVDRGGLTGQVVTSADEEPPPGALVVEAARTTDGVEAESSTLALSSREEAHTTLTLGTPLATPFDGATLELSANVVTANHGETATEILGSGDGARLFQNFTLRRPHLTYVVDKATGQIKPELTVLVDGSRWNPVLSLEDYGPGDRVFVLRRNQEGQTSLHFGDGVHGARLPTGRENVKVTYRAGSGRSGLIPEGRLSLMITRPPGIRSATNPLPSVGGVDGEGLEEIRLTAPRSTLTLGRVVSLTDYEDFARDFPGVGKALATNIGKVGAPNIYLTLADPDGQPLDNTSLVASHLTRALDQVRDTHVPVSLGGAVVVPFGMVMSLTLGEGADEVEVQGRVRLALAEAFSFDKRHFAQGVRASEVVAVVARVAGVVAVDFDHFQVPQATGFAQVSEELLARGARRNPSTGVMEPAELLLLSPDPAAINFQGGS